MGWDEKLFLIAKKIVSKKIKSRAAKSKTQVQYEDIKHKLDLLAKLLVSRSTEVKKVDTLGGLAGQRIDVPSKIDIFQDRNDNYLVYIYRILLASKLTNKVFLENLDINKISEINISIQNSYPGIAAWVNKAFKDEKYKDIICGEYFDLNSHSKVTKGDFNDGFSLEREVTTESQSESNEEAVDISEQKENEADNPVFHAFEKIETLEEYQGGNRQADGNDELDTHLEALKELKIKQVTRSKEKTKSVYRAQVTIQPSDGDSEISGKVSESTLHHYDEWDFSRGKYKKIWCSVFEEKFKSSTIKNNFKINIKKKFYKEIMQLKQNIMNTVNKRCWLTRQSEGEEVDIDAVVERYGDLKRQYSSKDKLYISKPKRLKDLSTLILFDSSLSTDSWISNRRILDIEKESLGILSCVLQDVHENSCIASFYSHTHKSCFFQILKDFNESWDLLGERMVKINPAGYTRIGPAIRHSVARLAQQKTRNKLLIIFTDAKPTDYDHYEGKYGIFDVRQAVMEAKKEGVHIKVLTIDHQSKGHLPLMFGAEGFYILKRPEDLVRQVAKIYQNII